MDDPNTDMHTDLRSYYEEEARQRLRRPLTGLRVELRDRFIELLADEGRSSVLDLGAGPGLDGIAFAEAGIAFAGVDLAHGNAVLAAEAGVTVVQGTIAAPPFRPKSFEAGWSMSTLMHIPKPAVGDIVLPMSEPLRAGAPLMVGLWGGAEADVIDDVRLPGHRRLFSRRPLAQNRELLANCGTIEEATSWDIGPDDGQYQTFLIRMPA